MFQQYIVFQIERDRCAVILTCVEDIVLSSYSYVVFRFQFLPQVGTQNTLMPHLGIQGCLSADPMEITSRFHSVNVRLVEVLAKAFVAYQLEVVVGAVPVYLWSKVEFTFGLGTYR